MDRERRRRALEAIALADDATAGDRLRALMELAAFDASVWAGAVGRGGGSLGRRGRRRAGRAVGSVLGRAGRAARGALGLVPVARALASILADVLGPGVRFPDLAAAIRAEVERRARGDRGRGGRRRAAGGGAHRGAGGEAGRRDRGGGWPRSRRRGPPRASRPPGGRRGRSPRRRRSQLLAAWRRATTARAAAGDRRVRRLGPRRARVLAPPPHARRDPPRNQLALLVRASAMIYPTPTRQAVPHRRDNPALSTPVHSAPRRPNQATDVEAPPRDGGFGVRAPRARFVGSIASVARGGRGDPGGALRGGGRDPRRRPRRPRERLPGAGLVARARRARGRGRVTLAASL